MGSSQLHYILSILHYFLWIHHNYTIPYLVYLFYTTVIPKLHQCVLNLSQSKCYPVTPRLHVHCTLQPKVGSSDSAMLNKWSTEAPPSGYNMTSPVGLSDSLGCSRSWLDRVTSDPGTVGCGSGTVCLPYSLGTLGNDVRVITFYNNNIVYASIPYMSCVYWLRGQLLTEIIIARDHCHQRMLLRETIIIKDSLSPEPIVNKDHCQRWLYSQKPTITNRHCHLVTFTLLWGIQLMLFLGE